MSDGEPSGKFNLFYLTVKDNYKTVRENTFSLSVKTAKKTQTTGRGNNFLGCVKPTGYKGIYPVGPQTVKKKVFSLSVFVFPVDF